MKTPYPELDSLIAAAFVLASVGTACTSVPATGTGGAGGSADATTNSSTGASSGSTTTAGTTTTTIASSSSSSSSGSCAACPANSVCEDGQCAPCKSGTMACDGPMGTCQNIASDNENCGGCGRVCGAPGACAQETCTLTYAATGSSYYSVPAGVTTIHAVIVSGGGSGAGNVGSCSGDPGQKGNVVVQDLSVTPGEMLTIGVAAPVPGGGYCPPASSGCPNGAGTDGISGQSSSVSGAFGTASASGGVGAHSANNGGSCNGDSPTCAYGTYGCGGAGRPGGPDGAGMPGSGGIVILSW